MNFKYLFLIVILLCLVGSSNASNAYALDYHTFEKKIDFINFLEQANGFELDLRSDYETSIGIKEQADQYGIDLMYYDNLQLYDSVFSKFSWWLTGFATGDFSDREANLEISENVVVHGQKMILNLANLNSLKLDKIIVLIDGQIVEIVNFDNLEMESMKTSNNLKDISITIPASLSLGNHILSIQDTKLKQEFKIREKELNIDPILKLSSFTINKGDSLTLVGANIPLRLSELNTLNVLANDEIFEVLQYPSQGVFKFEKKVDLAPGKYIISLENFPSTSTDLVVEAPYIEPKIVLSENFLEQGDKLIILGKNFQKEVDSSIDLILYGSSESVIENIKVDKEGEFERIFSTTNLNPGGYRIFSKEYSAVVAAFKLVLPEMELPIITTDLRSVEQGKSITLKGESFEEGSRITLSLDDFLEINVLCDDQGKFSRKIDTSNLFVGTHKIYWNENLEVSVPFNVEKKKPSPQVWLEDTKEYIGNDFKVYGSNFFDDSLVILYLDDSLIGKVSVDKQGNFISSLNLQFDEGVYKLIVKNSQGDILTAITLNLEEEKQAVMKVLTEPIYSSGDFKIKGFFFESGNAILKLDNLILKKFNIGKEGSFETTISLKDFENSPGTYKLLAEQNGEIKSFSTLNILKEKPNPLVKIQNEIVYEDSILKLNGNYFKDGKIGIRIDNLFNDLIFISESGTFEYSIDLKTLELSAGIYELNVGGIFLPLNIQGNEGPILKSSQYELFIGDPLIIYGDNFESTETLMLIIDDSFLYELDSDKFKQSIDTKEVGVGLHKARVQGYEPVVSFNIKSISSETPILKVLPDECFLGDKIIIKGFNFNSFSESLILKIKSLSLSEVNNFESLSEDIILSYNVYPINGNFELTLNSNELGVGHHEINVGGINYGFSISEVVSPSLKVLNQTIIQGQDLTLVGENFPIMTTVATNKLIIDGAYYGPIGFLEGSFKTQISTDNLDVGHHKIWVEGYDSVVGFTVNPQVVQMPEIRLSHQVATLGTRIIVTGSNFLTSSQETLILELPDGDKLTILYPSEGIFNANFLVSELSLGEHNVIIEGFDTARTSFLYQKSESLDPEIILSENRALVGEIVSGVVNNLHTGMVSKLDIILNGNIKIGELQSSGVRSAMFKFYAPQVSPGEYSVGLAGINVDMARLEILADPVPQKIEDYTPQQVAELQEEVMISFLDESNNYLVVDSIQQVAEIQDRMVNDNWASGLISADCISPCEVYCGQQGACGRRCSSADLNTPGKCGNSLIPITTFEKTAEKLSEKTANVLGRLLVLE